MQQKISSDLISGIYKTVSNQSHKGTQGHALIIGGSYGKMGAPLSASRAALRSGCGLVTAFVPQCGYQILQTAFPEAMVLTDAQQKHLSHIDYDFQPQAIGVGPGMGQEHQTQTALHQLLQHVKCPMVIDADALNILSQNPHWLSLVPPQTILTPHPKELQRLLGETLTDSEMQAKAQQLAQKHKLIIVAKGAPTHILDGQHIFENTTGNAALATAGSGDALTGILTSLLAQGYKPLEAAQLGVFLHGRCADLAVPILGREAFTASDLIAFLGRAFLSLPSGRGNIGFK